MLGNSGKIRRLRSHYLDFNFYDHTKLENIYCDTPQVTLWYRSIVIKTHTISVFGEIEETKKIQVLKIYPRRRHVQQSQTQLSTHFLL